MVIIWGQRLYGRVDQVADLFYVRTRFFHLYYIPLIPLASFVIFKGTESDDGFRGMKIPMSFKSVLVAWLRAILVLAIVVSSIFAIVTGSEALNGKGPNAWQEALLSLAVLAGSAFLFWLTTKLNKASYQRALRLGALLGINESAISQLYGMPYDAWNDLRQRAPGFSTDVDSNG